MSNWRTNIGGAISITGSSLLGVGLLVSPGELTPHQLKLFILAGLVLSAIGKGTTALFAADAKQMKNIQAQLDEVPQAIDSGNTERLVKVSEEQKPPKS
jgi:hypothetical protein